MFLKDGYFRFIYRSRTPEGPSSEPTLETQLSNETIELPQTEILDRGYSIPNGNAGQTESLNDCILRRFNDRNPLMTYEGAMRVLDIVEAHAPDYPGLESIRNAWRIRAGVIEGDPARAERQIARYMEILYSIRSMSARVAETQSDLTDLDEQISAVGVNGLINLRQNLEDMGQGERAFLGIGAVVVLIAALKQRGENNLMGRAVRAVGWVTQRAAAAYGVNLAVEAATGESITDRLRTANVLDRTFSNGLASYFGIENYEEDMEDRALAQGIQSILAFDHNDLFEGSVSFSDIYHAYDNGDRTMETIPRHRDGMFAGESGGALLYQVMERISGKYGNIDDFPEGSRVRTQFERLIDPSNNDTPQEALVDLMSADPEAEGDLFETFTDGVGEFIDDATIAVGGTVREIPGVLGGVVTHIDHSWFRGHASGYMREFVNVAEDYRQGLAEITEVEEAWRNLPEEERQEAMRESRRLEREEQVGRIEANREERQGNRMENREEREARREETPGWINRRVEDIGQWGEGAGK